MKLFFKLVKYSFKSLLLRKSRTFLTSLGIIIGTATIAVIAGIGAGAQQNIEDQYSNLSVTTIFVNPSAENADSKNGVDDIAPLLSESNYISSAIPQISKAYLFSIGSTSDTFTLVGTTSAFSTDLKLTYLAGSFFTEVDETAKAKKIILGFNVADGLFGKTDDSVIGQKVKISGKDFEVAGVIAYRGGSIGKVTIDDSGFTPIDTAQRYVIGNDSKVTIVLQAKSVDVIDDAITEARTILRTTHNLRTNDADDFKLKDMGSTVSSAVDAARTMSFLMGSVAVIILVVGGIGIMNIMYISVEERTREIGVRKALGAKYNHILSQFVLEAGLLSVFGSLAGIFIAIIVFWILQQANYAAIPVAWGFALAFFSSLLIGLFFGYYPAKKAAQMKPIDALRFE